MIDSKQHARQVSIGISPLSWTNDAINDLGDDILLETCLQDAVDAGYQGVELGRKFPRDAGKLKPLLAEYDLQLASGWHSGYLAERSVDEEWRDAKAHADLLSAMGCDVFIYGECSQSLGCDNVPLGQSPLLQTINIEQYGQRLGEFANRLSDCGLRLAYHHHLMMLVESLDETRTLLEQTPSNVGLCLDTGHAHAANFQYGKLLDEFASRIIHIHLKDVRDSVVETTVNNKESLETAIRKGIFTVPGDGDIDFGHVGKFVREQAYEGWLIVEAEQDPVMAPPKPTVVRAIDFVRRKIASSTA